MQRKLMSRFSAGVCAFALAMAGSAARGQEAVGDLAFDAEPLSEMAELDTIRGGASTPAEEMALHGAINIADQTVTNTISGSTVSAGGDLFASDNALSNNMMTVNMFNSGVNTTMGAQVSLYVNVYEAPAP